MFNQTVEYLKAKIPFVPQCAIILGTGLGGLADEVEQKIEIPYEQIPSFVKSTAPSHQGALIAGYISQTPVIVYKGRFHFYEGYTMQQVVYPVRIARLLGAKYLFVTNAAGSLNFDLKPGQLVKITDHINMMGTNPLIGANTLEEPVTIDGVPTSEFGERFPSQHAPYDKEISALADKIAHENGISLKEGVYCGLTGPTLETRAECLMLKSLGVDLVGMSTVPEIITAIHCGLKIFAVSVVTNLSNIFHSQPHSQEEIRRNADRASIDLLYLMKGIVGEIRNYK
jgi:purine-nucleoside phosphorylase